MASDLLGGRLASDLVGAVIGKGVVGERVGVLVGAHCSGHVVSRNVTFMH